MNKPIYAGQSLQSDEFLLKINGQTGFLTKLTQKGQLPKTFEEWPAYYGSRNQFPVYIHTEVPKSGWKLQSWRIGKSQEWAVMMHPEGFTVEIYLSNFLEIVRNYTIVNGVIQAALAWENHKLK